MLIHERGTANGEAGRIVREQGMLGRQRRTADHKRGILFIPRGEASAEAGDGIRLVRNGLRPETTDLRPD
jgi:hypothetical protein